MAQAPVKRTPSDPLWTLVAALGEGTMGITEVKYTLREYVNGMVPEAQEAWKAQAVAQARKLQSIAEALGQELTVIAAGQ